MKPVYSKEFKKKYKKLPASAKKQVDKQIRFIFIDFRHPSLKSRKMSGYKDVYEARVSKGYRLRYRVQKEIVSLLTVGPHDEGLGKK